MQTVGKGDKVRQLSVGAEGEIGIQTMARQESCLLLFLFLMFLPVSVLDVSCCFSSTGCSARFLATNTVHKSACIETYYQVRSVMSSKALFLLVLESFEDRPFCRMVPDPDMTGNCRANSIYCVCMCVRACVCVCVFFFWGGGGLFRFASQSDRTADHCHVEASCHFVKKVHCCFDLLKKLHSKIISSGLLDFFRKIQW